MKTIFAAMGGAVVGAAVVMVVDSGRPPALPMLSAAEFRSIMQAELTPLQGRLDQIARGVEASPMASAPAPERIEVKPPPQPPPLDLGPITSRIDTLEAKIDLLIDPSKEREQAGRKLAEGARRGLKDSQRVAVDRRASEKDRVDAFSQLRNKQTEDGQDARSHDVILAMLDLAEHSDSEDSRMNVYRNLHGAKDPAARDGMVWGLAHDPSPKVREKIAGDLDTFAGDPQVDSALRQAYDNDADGSVRARAWKTMTEGKKK
jgi:hypothetical protein